MWVRGKTSATCSVKSLGDFVAAPCEIEEQQQQEEEEDEVQLQR